jgi:hypothetical protein
MASQPRNGAAAPSVSAAGLLLRKLEVTLKTKRFLYSSVPSDCCQYKALLVLSREGGFISQNCLKCGKSDYVNPSQMPELNCEFCDAVLHVSKADGTNYHYVCDSCGRQWHLGSVLPDWSELFQYSGLAAHGDGLLQ